MGVVAEAAECAPPPVFATTARGGAGRGTRRALTPVAGADATAVTTAEATTGAAGSALLAAGSARSIDGKGAGSECSAGALDASVCKPRTGARNQPYRPPARATMAKSPSAQRAR